MPLHFRLELDSRLVTIDLARQPSPHSSRIHTSLWPTVVCYCARPLLEKHSMLRFVIGDSRVVVCAENSVRFASQDHKPEDDEERNRIKDAGGFIEMGRVCGNLAVSRALGDYEYKDRPDLGPEKQKVTAASDTTVLQREATDEFVLLACDGIWDVISNEGAVVFVNFWLKRGWNTEQIANELLDYCLRKGSKDNMSLILILLPDHQKADPTLVAQLVEGESQEDIQKRQNHANALLDEEISKVPGVNLPLLATDPPPISKPDASDATNTSPNTSPLRPVE
eukprot:TRINITY_DN11979_c1_g4_i4.p1 TRINITY_DN11979_c1_g4~~TRINITY_DN11979_c1_g4_i4.p1  ORF type:complete len:281 (+),score=16.98 TRINITY_DN11979_c1_g4_i4:518-1360(+)